MFRLEFNGTIKTSGEANELCTTLKCTFGDVVVMDGTQCKGRPDIQGLCGESILNIWSDHMCLYVICIRTILIFQ